MIVSLLVAMDEKRGIGKENRLPWRLSKDLKRFKELTMGHHLIMGRKTYQSIGRLLPGRITILISRDPDFEVSQGNGQGDSIIARSLDEALAIAEERGESEAFVVGGGQVFSQALAVADRIYLTQVHAETPADVFFPVLPEGDWSEVEVIEHPADEKNQYPFSFKLLIRRKSDDT